MTHDSTGTKATQDRRRSRIGVWTAVAVITLGVAGAITATVVDHQHDRANTDAAEQSAWENRESLEALMGDTLERIGLEGEPQDVRDAPFQCVRNDGRDGWSYRVTTIHAGPVDDVDHLLSSIADYWENQGLTVGRGEASGAQALSGTTPDGAVLQVFAGDGGTSFTGDTMCALRDGAPSSEG